ncbi:MAG: hypothetical protein OHK0040_04440 [bacterium]
MASKKNKSALKRERQSLVRRERNKSVKSAIKTQIKKVRSAIEAKNEEAVKTELTKVQSCLDKAAIKGIIHKNKAARHKARLAKRAAKITAAA